MIKIYTDGSCIGNPGKGGWAAVNIHVENETKECGLTSAENLLNNLI